MPTFNPNQRTVQVPVPVDSLPKVVEAPKPQPQQALEPAPIKSNRTIVLPFIHQPEQ